MNWRTMPDDEVLELIKERLAKVVIDGEAIYLWEPDGVLAEARNDPRAAAILDKVLAMVGP